MTIMLVGFFQFAPRFGEVSHNLDQVVEKLDQADADLIVLPELFASGYQFVSRQEVITLSESVPNGPTTQRLIDLAKRRRMVIVAGLPERAGVACYNSAVVVGPSGFIGCYRKTHLFFEETLFFTPGDSGFQVWDIGPAKIGVMICFDWYYPEAARTLALKGAEIICHPSNLVLPDCPDSMPVRCLENRVFAITSNRTGSEARGGKNQLTFIGNSEIVTPQGAILHRAPRDQEELSIVEIDPAAARNKAITPYNDLLRDRRESLYHLEDAETVGLLTRQTPTC
jgi:predicted amidohydrolase